MMKKRGKNNLMFYLFIKILGIGMNVSYAGKKAVRIVL